MGRRSKGQAMKSAGEFPAYRMARDLAGKVFPVSEAVILQTARRYGIGRKMGRAVIFSPEDCTLLYEVLPCPSGSSADPNRPIGLSGVRRRYPRPPLSLAMRACSCSTPLLWPGLS